MRVPKLLIEEDTLNHSQDFCIVDDLFLDEGVCGFSSLLEAFQGQFCIGFQECRV